MNNIVTFPLSLLINQRGQLHLTFFNSIFIISIASESKILLPVEPREAIHHLSCRPSSLAQ